MRYAARVLENEPHGGSLKMGDHDFALDKTHMRVEERQLEEQCQRLWLAPSESQTRRETIKLNLRNMTSDMFSWEIMLRTGKRMVTS
jgi:hypothetical protein